MKPTIDMNYLRHVSDYIPNPLPRPRRKKRLETGYPVIMVPSGEDK